jgi:hypothetical protein
MVQLKKGLKCRGWDHMGNMEEGQLGLKHSSWNVTCFDGICFMGSGCPNIKTPARPRHQNLTCFDGCKVLRLMFCGLRFLTGWNKCQAATETCHVSVPVCSRAPMPVRGNLCQAASKWAIHLRLVTEITTGIDKMYLLCTHPEYQRNPFQSKQSKHFHQRNRFS